MSRFIATDTGWLNLDHVARIEMATTGKPRPPMIFLAPDGRSLGRLSWCLDFDPEELTGPVIAAAPGSVAVVVSVAGDNIGSRPTETFESTVPIVAWRIIHGGAVPVLIDALTSNETVLLQIAGGGFLLPDTTIFDNLADARKYLLDQAQRAWDSVPRRCAA